jgi:hypothetical protein
MDGATVNKDEPAVPNHANNDNNPAIDPLRNYRDQKVEWKRCDSIILGENHEGVFDRLGARLQCAHYRVPLDYDHVDRGDLSNGLATAFQLFSALKGSDPNDTLGAMNLHLLAEYDMIGFSPRGTGISTRVHCGTNEQLYFEDISSAGKRPENLAKLDYNGRKTAEACCKNPLIPQINSNTTA